MSFPGEPFVGIAVAALGGAAIGLEREQSRQDGHSGFAGFRTFTLLGVLGGTAGYCIANDLASIGVVMLAAAAAIVVAGYAVTARTDVGATTEVAALIVIAAGALAGASSLWLSASLFAITAILLKEKTRLHGWVQRVDDRSLRATLQFALMAVVILPLLPEGPYGPWGGIRPRELWMMVLFFSGVSFIGYIANRISGSSGYVLTGILGGIVSSTNITLTFSRLSKQQPDLGVPLALGVMGACGVMYVRMAGTVAVLNRQMLMPLLPYVAAPVLVVVVFLIFQLRRNEQRATVPEPANPLNLKSAMQVAALFQVVLFIMYLAQAHLGAEGVYATAAVMGLTDVDALVLAMTRHSDMSQGVRAIAVGALSNTAVKMGLAIFLGTGRFRLLAGGGLFLLGAASGAALLLV